MPTGIWWGHCLSTWQCWTIQSTPNKEPTCAFWLGNFWILWLLFDLALSDFFLYPQLKKSLGGCQFTTDAWVKNAVNSFSHQEPPVVFSSGHAKSCPNIILSIWITLELTLPPNAVKCKREKKGVKHKKVTQNTPLYIFIFRILRSFLHISR